MSKVHPLWRLLNTYIFNCKPANKRVSQSDINHFAKAWIAIRQLLKPLPVNQKTPTYAGAFLVYNASGE
jgi:hypothetical protein